MLVTLALVLKRDYRWVNDDIGRQVRKSNTGETDALKLAVGMERRLFWISDGLDLRCGRKGDGKDDSMFGVPNTLVMKSHSHVHVHVCM